MWVLLPSTRAEMTLHKADSERLILVASFRRVPCTTQKISNAPHSVSTQNYCTPTFIRKQAIFAKLASTSLCDYLSQQTNHCLKIKITTWVWNISCREPVNRNYIEKESRHKQKLVYSIYNFRAIQYH